MEYKFGARFEQYRKQNGYTQAQLAVVLGIKQSSISDWENDISRPEYENLIALSKLYDESIDTLLGNEKIIK